LDANADKDFQATGFVASVSDERVSGYWHYLVTNWHVVKALKWNVWARFSRATGGILSMNPPKDHWVIDEENDLAAAAIDIPTEMMSYARIDTTQFLSLEAIFD
jgi:hypothetical protein